MLVMYSQELFHSFLTLRKEDKQQRVNDNLKNNKKQILIFIINIFISNLCFDQLNFLRLNILIIIKLY